MYAELSVSEAERMLKSIRKLGKYHENSKFLAKEALGDLKDAERHLRSMEADEMTNLKERIDKARKEITSFNII